MKLKTIILIIAVTVIYGLTNGQVLNHEDKPIVAGDKIFRDTFNNIITDTFNHHLGRIHESYHSFTQYFGYIGSETINIVDVWTGDPHFICKYPRETLTKGKIYEMTVCFYNYGRPGSFSKTMGFTLSNGQRIFFSYTGFVLTD